MSKFGKRVLDVTYDSSSRIHKMSLLNKSPYCINIDK